MSTEHQQYSTENQIATIQKYATAHGMEVVRTFADYGKSGLSLHGREGLKALLSAVESGRADFGAILVYDISRWGRFQDADESAYYEYICRRAHIAVHYCAEPFSNDGSLSSTLLKSLKRTMAGEFSRELSVKVFAGQCRLIELGFRQGGTAGYGLRRLLVDPQRNPKGILERGEHKSIHTDRVILVPGPTEEVRVVREIYDLFTAGRVTENRIARILNARGLRSDTDVEWTRNKIHWILTSPKYVGDNVFNRGSSKLQKKRVRNPQDMWVRRNDCHECIIPRELFAKAQAIISARPRNLTNEELLDKLRDVLQRDRTLSRALIDELDGMPAASTYRRRFKTLSQAFSLVGCTPGRDYAYVALNRAIRKKRATITQEIIQQLTDAGVRVQREASTKFLRVADEFTLSIVLACCRQSSGGQRWVFRFHGPRPDLVIGVRLAPANDEILDYYLLPGMECLQTRLWLALDNGITLDIYRFPDLNQFYALARRANIPEAP